MVELRLQIPDELVEKLQAKLGERTKVTDIARDAITLFNWAVDERAKGRFVLSSGANGDDVARLTMPSLESAAAKAEKG
ncbi:MAG: hypothetical protein C3F11_15745 [Methylocystaceae bacterium]|nr:MAG: hypothetical protein C3F11_15745 [Methylocystaceae bacterium]